MINLLLQGIIAANPHHDSTVTPEVRLVRAREALLGEKTTRGRKTIREDLQLFPLIEEALKADKDQLMRAFLHIQRPETQAEWEQELARPPKSLRAMAKEKAPEFQKPATALESAADRIRKSIAKMNLTPQDMADLEGLFHGDSEKAKCLQRIFDDLKTLGIACENPMGRKVAN